MLDIGASELLLIVVVAVVVIGPKDLPRAMRLAGQWIAKVRRVSGHFRSGIETMIREAELAEMEKKWREQNEAIMRSHPAESVGAPAASAEAALLGSAPAETIERAQFAAQREAERQQDATVHEPTSHQPPQPESHPPHSKRDEAEPQLPLPPP